MKYQFITKTERILAKFASYLQGVHQKDTQEDDISNERQGF